MTKLEEFRTAFAEEIIDHQQDWRLAKAEEYPDDDRNAQCAAALGSLSKFVQHTDDEEAIEVLRKLEAVMDTGTAFGLPLFEQPDLNEPSLAQRALSRHGFSYRVSEPVQHIELLEELVVLCVQDAYNGLRNRCGEGAWESAPEYHETVLSPDEIQAAKEGVILPDRYFERRAKSTEEENMTWIEAERRAQVEVR